MNDARRFRMNAVEAGILHRGRPQRLFKIAHFGARGASGARGLLPVVWHHGAAGPRPRRKGPRKGMDAPTATPGASRCAPKAKHA
jgi:hypothetical protein